MRKNVWIFHHYATSPNKGGLVRAYDFAKQLEKKGYSPTIFSSAFNHYTGENINIEKGKYIHKIEEGVSFLFVKTKTYSNNGLDRVKNMFSFYFNLFPTAKQWLKEGHAKPDIIIASSLHPLTCVTGIKIAKKYKIPCIVEIRDLWPESLLSYSKKFTKKHPFIQLLYQGEKWIYKKADKLIFTMEGGKQYIIDQGWNHKIDLNKVYHINNGVDLEVFDYNKEYYTIEDEDLDNPDIFKVVYTGSVRRVNNLGMILDAAKQITNDKIKILIWGNGDEVDFLQQRIVNEKITNCVLKGGVEKKYIPYILSKADVNLLHYKYSNIYKYGTSQNKNFEYIASAKPVLSTIKMAYDVVEKANAGISLDKQSVIEIKNSIVDFYNIDRNQLIEMGNNGRTLSTEYDFKVLTNKLIDCIERF